MTQQFKFGDMVQHPEFGRGVIVAAFDHSADVVFENHRNEIKTIGFHFMNKLELIPHPDTARLDWLEKNQFQLGTYYDDDELGFIDLRYVVYQPDKQGCRIKLSDEKSYRQAIDHAMQQEQSK